MRTQRISPLIIAALIVVSGTAPASAQVTQSLPSAMTDALTRSAIPLQSVGAYVQEVTNPKPLIALNAEAGFNPASTMKLVTTNAALELLGPAFTWKTKAYIRGTLADEVLHGDLIIRGEGDPKLVTEKFWQLLRQIRASGVREIRGNLILDRSQFQARPHDAGAFDDYPLKPYNVGPDALLLNYNVMSVHFLPDAARGVATIQFDPPVAWTNAQPPRLSSGACGDWQTALKPQFNPNGVVFEGAYPAACGEKTWYLHPYRVSPTAYFGQVFRQLWTDVGGRFDGVVTEGAVSPDARQIAEWQSPPLPEIVRDINKFSNNVMARHVLLAMAAASGNVPATPEFGANLVRAWLSRKGIDTTKLVIENGSGLSRIEQITPEEMGRMLVAAYQSPIMPEFISSMPIVGLDGTMRRRLVNNDVAGRAHIKTGSLDGVRAVAGYVQALSGRRYVVVCIINDIRAEAGRAAQDALLQWVHENG
ncbi:MAG: D-alanyl-D-alanine carboxypeptidase/D-alanyl-D-alanine-endopeptidase [Oxalicibacterium faecigallinarum]|uniref:D-alanyl-D-alanine carboxypeptidase/D-alanyl-D-alanine endopeptidase n=1 Tax=Oxalicibacterium faecigallinarum TaxID=573741 RepID=UPI002807669F|nr:D-alanyl-D-alanine carboxypeptidase/D-alanyl-D-alanine-endopeptidase [Oxalicibacterium faecigallinarum]MDQ7968663.1 D-alanyl-D-alanine carboxypeptidase/D-alanyl-D-alanine-endopeptidase [Oxalicibacterium faecigallinarum]